MALIRFLFVTVKLKTNKSLKKRFKITKNKKVLFRPPNQNHFNAKESGDERRRKRKKNEIKGAIAKKIIKTK